MDQRSRCAHPGVGGGAYQSIGLHACLVKRSRMSTVPSSLVARAQRNTRPWMSLTLLHTLFALLYCLFLFSKRPGNRPPVSRWRSE